MLYRVLLPWRILLLIGLSLVGPAGAGAAEVGLIGVFDPYSDDAAQRATTARLVEAVRASGHTPIVLQEMGDILAREADGVLRLALLDGLTDTLRGAEALLDQGRVAAAHAVLSEAMSQVEAASQVVPVSAARVRVAAVQASISLAEGDEVGTERALRRIVAIQPYTVPPRVADDPGLASRFATVRDAAVSTPATLEVTAASRRATLRIDGRPAGGLPRTLDNVVPGPHDLHVRAADGRVGVAHVDVGPGDIVEISVPLTAPTVGDRALDAPLRARRLRDLLVPLGAALDVDVLFVVGRVEDGRVVGQLVDAREGVFGRPVQGPDAVALWEAIAPEVGLIAAREPLPLDPSGNLALTTALRLPPVPGLTTIDPMDPDLSPTRRGTTEMWVGIGVGAAVAIAVGVTLGVVLGGPPPAPDGYGTVVIGPPR